jgi:PKD repeat protein
VKTLIGLALLVALLACLGCDAGTSPVAPDGTLLRIDANPTSITVMGSSAITITAIDSSGVPAPAGTEILLTTNLGTIEDRVSTDSRGIAHATLHADGRSGTAMIKASSGKVMASTPASVVIGASALKAGFDVTVGESLTAVFRDTSQGTPTSWDWSFGDGHESTQQSPSHTYATASSYVVTLKVRNPDGQDTLSKVITVPASEAMAPVASFDVAVDGLQATFTDTSKGTVRSWQWDFGDGSRTTVQHATHIYGQPGIYSVTLIVSNAAGSSTASKSVTVPTSQAPVANFTSREVDVRRVLFADTSTNNPTRWEWDFGDDTAKVTDRNPIHTYAKVGTYRVSLTAGNLAGQSTHTDFIVVRGPLVADFSFAVQGDHTTVVFTDQSAGEPTSFAWNFGDGSNLVMDRDPVHKYSEPKDYTVTLTVMRMVSGGSAMEQATVSKIVTVPGNP